MTGARRDLLKLAGGAAVGAALSPAPWRLLGDTAIWSQNWSWMPRVPRGERTEKEVRCALCPAGCQLRARCVGETPYAMMPAARAICPAGVVGHHVALHPLRLRETLHRGAKSTREQAVEAARTASRQGGVAVLDLLPGRVASQLHRERMKEAGGRYLAAPVTEGSTARAVGERMGAKGSLRMQLAAARTVLSVSTPVLDGWAGPDLAARPAFHLVQAETRQSATARRAGEWLPVRPGGETALLLALLECVEGREAPADLASRCGVATDRLTEVASRLRQGPSLVIADGEPLGGLAPRETLQAAAALQMRLGLDAYRVSDEPASDAGWEDVAAGSIRLLIVDEPVPGVAVPWSLVAPKLAADAVVVAVSWNRQSLAKQAEWLVPAPVYLEGLHEAPPRHDAAAEAITLSEGWLTAPDQAVFAADFVSEVLGGGSSYAERLKSAKPAVLQAVTAGGRPEEAAERSAWRALALREAPGLTVVAYGWRQAGVSPLLGKLWQESELMAAPNSAVRDEEKKMLAICATPAYVRDQGKAVRS
jgi:hypothetical protein